MLDFCIFIRFEALCVHALGNDNGTVNTVRYSQPFTATTILQSELAQLRSSDVRNLLPKTVLNSNSVTVTVLSLR